MTFAKKDMLETKTRKLEKCRRMFDDAVEVVNSTVARLEYINACASQEIQEIDEYEAHLQETKLGLIESQNKNARVIQNFKALLGE